MRASDDEDNDVDGYPRRKECDGVIPFLHDNPAILFVQL